MLTTRKANLEDCPVIVPLWIASMQYHENFNPIFHTAPGYKDKVAAEITELLEKPHVTFFLAEWNGSVIGFSMTTVNDRPPVFAQPKRGYIGFTYITDEYRARGVGSEFVELIIKWFKSQHVDFIDLQVSVQNEPGVKFWEKQGFKTVNYYMVRALDKE